MPQREVCWLGYWSTPSISTMPHLVKRLAKVQAAFVVIKRLSLPLMGLPPFLFHRLGSSPLFLILSYGGNSFKLTIHLTRKLSAFRHMV